MPEVREERTGWRDEALSARHREWGWDCPAIDIDLLFLEYDNGKPIALVEYKHERAAPARSSHPSCQALIKLGDRANVPVFACRYSDDFSEWRAVPLNCAARLFLPKRKTMNEHGWVSFLYSLRGRQMPMALSDRLAIRDCLEAADV